MSALRSSERRWSARAYIAHLVVRQSTFPIMAATRNFTLNDPSVAIGLATPIPYEGGFVESQMDAPVAPVISAPPPHGEGFTPAFTLTHNATYIPAVVLNPLPETAISAPLGLRRMLLETVRDNPLFPVATRPEAALDGIAVPMTSATEININVEIFNICEFLFFIV